MRNFIKGTVATIALGAASVAVVQPAQARDHTGTAVVAGIVGLGVGAALASGSNRGRYGSSYGGYYGGGYSNGYYGGGNGYYGGGGGYYAPSFGVVYDRGWSDRGRHRGWGRGRGGWDRRDRGRW